MKRKVGPAHDAVLAGIEPALKRAALRAREIAARTGTPLVYYRNGKIVREMVTSKRRATVRTPSR